MRRYNGQRSSLGCGECCFAGFRLRSSIPSMGVAYRFLRSSITSGTPSPGTAVVVGSGFSFEA